MATFHSVVKQIVLQNIDLSEREGQTLRQVYESEYGYNGITPQACQQYLMGLPSVCTIPFNNFEILELLKAAGFDKVTEKGRYGLIEKYWKEAGNQFYHLIK
ncbi:hypothetical protein D3C85_1179360 [compost metagenome]